MTKFQFNTNKILWAGSGIYQEFRDRKSLDCVWIPHWITPLNKKISDKDCVEFKRIPTTFNLVDHIYLTEDKVVDKIGQEINIEESPYECDDFGFGYAVDSEFCKDCKQLRPDQYIECKNKYKELVNTLKFRLWTEVKPGHFVYKEEKQVWNLRNAYLIEMGNEKKTLAEKNPFKSTSKLYIIFDELAQGRRPYSEVKDAVVKRLDREKKKDEAYFRNTLVQWKHVIPRMNNKYCVDNTDGYLEIIYVKEQTKGIKDF